LDSTHELKLDHLAYVVFSVAGEAFAIASHHVKKILPMAKLSHSTSLPRTTEGMLNLSGQNVPIFKLAKILGVSENPPHLYTPIIILNHSPHLIGIWVDTVQDVVTPRAEEVSRLKIQHLFGAYVQGQMILGDKTIYIIDPKQLILAEEIQRISDLEKRQTERNSTRE
jgi:purine-binding chemotaxis protein CheW